MADESDADLPPLSSSHSSMYTWTSCTWDIDIEDGREDKKISLIVYFIFLTIFFYNFKTITFMSQYDLLILPTLKLKWLIHFFQKENPPNYILTILVTLCRVVLIT